MAAISAPSTVRWTAGAPRALLGFTLVYGIVVAAFISSARNTRRGEEHGSAKWGDAARISRKYRDPKHPGQNIILTQHFQISVDGHKHQHNTHVLVIGGSGAGKSRGYAIPNVLTCGDCSVLVCDPKGEILRKTGAALKAHGFEVRVFDLIDPDNSYCYNPLAYLRDDKDVLRLIETLIQSTTPPGSQNTDPF